MIDEKILVFFDGPCNFCNSFVNFIIKKDKHDKFRFSSLQSTFAKDILGDVDYNTIVVKHHNLLLKRSKAILYILSNLSFPYTLICIFNAFPIKLLDYIYNFIAKRRNKIFKKDKCVIPTADSKKKIIQ
ncbi:MAG: thiol-disulfide oxidoreductase DCC family protein [Solitalea-like symbiont of Tyrophagus putrescentiae]